jgi:hypothetical protein
MSEPGIRPAARAPGPTSATASLSPLAAEFAALLQPDAIARMLDRHVDDGTGHCRECSSGGQTGRSTWPCRLRVLAEEASRGAPGGAR